MGETAHKWFGLSERSYSSLIKKNIREIASSLKFSKTRAAEVDIIASEIITNLIKHATNGGEILTRVISSDGFNGLEIIGLDIGPGIKDIKKMTGDGVSTTNTLGHGLGSIKRLSDEFDIYSQEGWGTVIMSRVWENGYVKKKSKFEIAAVMVPKEGEAICGDGWVCKETLKYLKVGVFDGLGHGPNAHIASEAASNSFINNIDLSPDQLLYQINNDIKYTRGAVGFILEIDKEAMSASYAGIGNISGKNISRQAAQGLFSYNGTIGHVVPNHISNHNIDLKQTELIIIFSDGIKTKWDIGNQASFFNHHPAIIAACIYNQKKRVTDDATVVVIKKNRNF
jgi:anti-sigma regulatory factor (Ser/Thr protein kinase)